MFGVVVLVGMAPIDSQILNAWPTARGTMKRCGLVGGSLSPWGRALRSSMLKLHSVWDTVSCCLQIENSRHSP